MIPSGQSGGKVALMQNENARSLLPLDPEFSRGLSHRLVVSILFCLSIGNSNACPDPHAPAFSVSSDQMVLRHNTYAPDSVMCIVRPNLAYCPGCREGWRHRCETYGVWTPTEACLPRERATALQELAKHQMEAALSSQLEASAGRTTQEPPSRDWSGQLEAISDKSDAAGAGMAGELLSVVTGSAARNISSAPSTGRGPGDCPTSNALLMAQLQSPDLRAAPAVDYMQVVKQERAYVVAELSDQQAVEAERNIASYCNLSGTSQAACLVYRDTVKLNRHMADAMRCLARQGY